jgi:tetratricopeptide (TPR) repeat protein
MDNATICYNGIQRLYRNALVNLIRDRLTEYYKSSASTELRQLFAKRDSNTGVILWEKIEAAAKERRSAGTGEVTSTIEDEFDLLGVEFFYNVFEKFFDVLCPKHASKPKGEKNQAKTTLQNWMRTIKNFRDPLSHPTTADFSFEDSANVLYCARKVLDFCELPEPADQILKSERRLHGGVRLIEDQVYTCLPPEDEVVHDFIGRHVELTALNRWFENPRAKRWALSGDGGKGKSAIAYSFARSLSARVDTGIDAVLWISGKRRRFVEGQTIVVDRPDFHDLDTAIRGIIEAYGEDADPLGGQTQRQEFCLKLLREFPSLLVIDDIDTLDNEAEKAIEFLLMDVPSITRSRILVTSRRLLFGMQGSTTQVSGLSPTDADAFIRSRCDLMGIPISPVVRLKDQILKATDSSPLFIEDLFRMSQAGLGMEEAIGLWSQRRGDAARRYAVEREYERLHQDAKHLLLALSLEGPCTSAMLAKGLDWNAERVLNALEELKLMFLVPSRKQVEDDTKLALDQNTKKLVLDVFDGTDAYRRVERQMQGARGDLRTKRSEERDVSQALRRARLLVNQCRPQEAQQFLSHLLSTYPGRADIHANLGWVYKRGGRLTDARDEFRRAHQLGCKDRDAYWHWSELEADEEEWSASEEIADLGLRLFPGDQGLLYRKGYAVHRTAKERYFDGSEDDAVRLSKKAMSFLEQSLNVGDASERSSNLLHQIYRALVLTAEVLGDGPCVRRYLIEWRERCPDNIHFESDYERLRSKFPGYLPRLHD